MCRVTNLKHTPIIARRFQELNVTALQLIIHCTYTVVRYKNEVREYVANIHLCSSNPFYILAFVAFVGPVLCPISSD